MQVRCNRLLIASWFALVVCVSAGQAQAQAQFEFGLRTGYGVPLGKIDDQATEDIDGLIAGQIPIWFDIGARVQDHLFIGGYVSPGIGLIGDVVGNQCDAAETAAQAAGGDYSCSVFDMRLGLELLYHFAPPGRVSPFLGVGFGYEWLSFTQSADVSGQSADLTLKTHGPEFLNLQGGVDIALNESFALGPFASFSLAQFDTATFSCSGDCAGFSNQSNDVQNKTLHNWLFLGIRGTGLP